MIPPSFRYYLRTQLLLLFIDTLLFTICRGRLFRMHKTTAFLGTYWMEAVRSARCARARISPRRQRISLPMAGRLISFQRNKATEAENSSVLSRDRLGINSIAEASRASERACPVACIITPLLKRLYPSKSFSSCTGVVWFPNIEKEKTNF